MTTAREPAPSKKHKLTRRDLLLGALAGTGLGTAVVGVQTYLRRRESQADVFIGQVASYEADLRELIANGLKNLGVTRGEIKGKRILLKPNLIETAPGALHICTQPQMVYGASEAFLALGASKIIVAEGSGHSRDMLRVLEETGLADMLRLQKLDFVDLNNDELTIRRNARGFTGLRNLTLPSVLNDVDWVVSMPKMKTHHWAAVTLSMKNLFGLMPGIVYGWPKNVFHIAGIHQSILDINATVKPHFAIVDGVVGMEGDGPIMGIPKPAGVIVMGRNLAATDATSARIMGIDPWKVPYLKAARGWLGTVSANKIIQRGEAIGDVCSDFLLLDHVGAHQGVRLDAKT